MSDQDYDEYLRFLNSLEDEDEERRQLEKIGLSDHEPLDVSDYDPE